MEIAKVTISHPDKIMYSHIGINKAQIAKYYDFIAEYMLPYIKNRPISLKHFPEGVEHSGFYHKHASKFYPDYVQRFTVPTSHHGVIEMVGIDNAQALVYLAGQNTIEFHMGLATVANLKMPDQIILDFDPSDADFNKVRKAALLAKEILDQQNLHCFVKTTGSRGLHLHIPLKANREYTEIKPISKKLAEYIVQQMPDMTTIEHRINKRGDRVFIDYLRNDYSATAIAPYSLRANQWAGIATPISWDEVKNNKKLTPYAYNINNIRDKMRIDANPWDEWKV
jgi:bifunctional non-homologous end joining protein LigD